MECRRSSPSGLRDPRLERVAQRLADGLELDAVQDVLEEPADDDALRLGAERPRAIR